MAVESTAKPDAHRQPKPKPDRASNTDKGSSSTAESMAESEQDQFLALAKQLAELSRLEVASHDALTKRVADLEANLASSRKELAEVRVRNEALTKQLQAAQPAIEAAARLLDRPAPAPASPAPTPAPSSAASAPQEGEKATPTPIDGKPPPLVPRPAEAIPVPPHDEASVEDA